MCSYQRIGYEAGDPEVTDHASVIAGHLYGVGLGPGDPELITLRGASIIRHADVVVYHAGTHGRSTARKIAGDLLDSRDTPAIEELLRYPVTTGGSADYAERMAAFYTEATQRLAEHLRAGRSVAVLSLGDPMLYSSYQHLHRALETEFPAHIVPGISSVSAAAAELRHPLAEATDILTVLPATADRGQLLAAAQAADCLVIMKLGGHVEKIRSILDEAGKLDRAQVVVRATMDGSSIAALADVDADAVPYFSVAVVGTQRTGYLAQDEADTVSPGSHTADNDASGESSYEAPRGEVVVVGLGPGAERWTTPEVSAELAAATDIVGYSTYVNRVPDRAGQTKHLSDNRVEAERSALALDLAKAGKRVVVVSSGDPGVFAMASAVLETADDDAWRDIPVRIVPGMTAAQAVASRVGAPLGHDYAMISLSNRLKPWDVVEKRIRAVAGADMAFAVYNPASKSRRQQVVDVKNIMLEYQDPQTPVIVARAVGSDQEKVTITTVGDFDPDIVDMRTMLIFGASSTQRYTAGDGSERVYTARHYAGGGTNGTGALL
ncbi:precorrin-3B C(17)-methyltransferase [Corynebacterium sp. H113]|uniref:precorrin-3B C(17)-methyltransferase n=1 Tax=Corynebacterium sp. H113 TaxID=3133419 RepID=UPI00403FFE23